MLHVPHHLSCFQVPDGDDVGENAEMQVVDHTVRPWGRKEAVSERNGGSEVPESNKSGM